MVRFPFRGLGIDINLLFLWKLLQRTIHLSHFHKFHQKTVKLEEKMPLTCSTFFTSAIINASISLVISSLSIFFNLDNRYLKHLSRVISSPPAIWLNCN